MFITLIFQWHLSFMEICGINIKISKEPLSKYVPHRILVVYVLSNYFGSTMLCQMCIGVTQRQQLTGWWGLVKPLIM